MSFQSKLEHWLKGCRRLAIVGIGNPLKQDDASGLEVLRKLGRMPQNVKLFECQTMPENFIGKIRKFKPTHVLMIDAACFGGKPGEAKLFPPEEIGGMTVSTHAMPLSLFAEIIQQNVSAKVALLGIQPLTVDFGESLTPELDRVTNNIAEFLTQKLRHACS